MHFGEEQRRAMVERQLKARGIGSARLLDAFEHVPREAFVPANLAEFALDDTPLPIGHEQTISQPYVVALMIEAAEVQPTHRVLEVGTGSGYSAALLAELAGQVFTVERHEALANAARMRLDGLGYRNVTVITGDGSEGLPDEAPFDGIIVAARGEQVPDVLRRQLAVGGRLVMPVGGDDLQALRLVMRTGTQQWQEDDLGAVRFVPLIGQHGLPEVGTRAASNHRPARNVPLPELIAECAHALPPIDDPEFAGVRSLCRPADSDAR